MRTQPAITILTAALLLFGMARTTHGAVRRQTSSRTSSSKAEASSSVKKTSTAKKRTSTTKRSTKRTVRARMPAAPTPARISEIQSALAEQGNYQGVPNGKWDAATINAMQHFQQAHGLDGTGKLDAPTLQKLGLGSDVAGVAAPLPQPQANSGVPAATSAQSQNP